MVLVVVLLLLGVGVAIHLSSGREPPPRPLPSQRTDWEPTFSRAAAPHPRPSPPRILRGPAFVVDGDTIKIQGQSIRLAGIDAPELDHPYGNQAKWALIRLCKGHDIRAEIIDGETTYERLVATCYLPDGRDLAAELVRQGLALDWGKHSGGKYRALETPEARKRLWRSAAKHAGKVNPG